MTDITQILAEAISLSFREEGYIEGVSEPQEWDEYVAAARACLTALSEAGWVVVPKEPTEEMMEKFYGCRHDLATEEDMKDCWRSAMVAAGQKEMQK